MSCRTPLSVRFELSERDKMVLLHMPLVHHLARRLHARLGGSEELEDLVSAGTEGLISAVDGFDAARGLAFSTYAAPRIRGAMLDELRRLDPASRVVRRKGRELVEARGRLMSRLGRQPLSTETADALGVDVETLWRWQDAVEATVEMPLESGPAADGRPASPAETLAGEDGRSVVLRVEQEEQAREVQKALQLLSERERTVLTLHYYEGLKLREIGEVLGLTESRISQVRTGALRRLRECMER